jgi:uncharacterized coiled-coil DUF342 family protein
MVNLTQPSNLSALKTEIAHFREELKMRDQLVQQLSQELFRIVKSDHPSPGAMVASDHRGEIRVLREQLQGVETQVNYYQNQLQNRDQEIKQLRRTVQELSARSQMLEQVVQELPRIYSQKFAERLAPIREKIANLHRDNQRLQTELQQVSGTIPRRELQLPDISKVISSMSTFGPA